MVSISIILSGKSLISAVGRGFFGSYNPFEIDSVHPIYKQSFRLRNLEMKRILASIEGIVFVYFYHHQSTTFYNLIDSQLNLYFPLLRSFNKGRLCDKAEVFNRFVLRRTCPLEILSLSLPLL